MKKISKKDALRIQNHLQKAKEIIDQVREISDDGEISMDIEIAENCVGYLDEILIAINNTILD
jgi:hypothetical protein